MIERRKLHTFKGAPLVLVGDSTVEVGEKAPNFVAYKSLTDRVQLSDFAGKTVIISAVPSVDTPVCSNQTARFVKEVAAMGDDVVLLTISRDLPFAMGRWCATNGAAGANMLSDAREGDFGRKFGIVIREFGLLARAVFVVGKDGVLKYSQIVPEMATEPDYAPVLAAARA